jgi:hypothetical protein
MFIYDSRKYSTIMIRTKGGGGGLQSHILESMCCKYDTNFKLIVGTYQKLVYGMKGQHNLNKLPMTW